MKKHYEGLERLHLKSVTNNTLKSNIKISQGEAELTFNSNKLMHNALKEIHNAYYFMALETVSFYAANSLIEDVLLFTKSFEITFSKKTTSDKFIAKGKFNEKSMGNYIITAELYDFKDNIIAKGKGIFRRSKNLLEDIKNYNKEDIA